MNKQRKKEMFGHRAMSKDEQIDRLVGHLANMFGFNLMMFSVLSNRAPEALDEVKGGGETVQEVTGVLYSYRRVLQENLDPEEYKLFAEAAMFPLYEKAEETYRKTGDFSKAVMSMAREFGALKKANDEARQKS